MLARFRFEFEDGQAPGPGARKWFLYHDAAIFRAEVWSMSEVSECSYIEPGMPGYDGLLVIFSTSYDRVVLCPYAPLRRHPDVDSDLMKLIEGRESPLLVRYPNGRHWHHIPGDSIT